MRLLLVTHPRAEPDYARRQTAYCELVHGRGSSSNGLRRACRCHRETVASSTSRRGGRAKPFVLRVHPGISSLTCQGQGAVCPAGYPRFSPRLTPTYWVT